MTTSMVAHLRDENKRLKAELAEARGQTGELSDMTAKSVKAIADMGMAVLTIARDAVPLVPFDKTSTKQRVQYGMIMEALNKAKRMFKEAQKLEQ